MVSEVIFQTPIFPLLASGMLTGLYGVLLQAIYKALKMPNPLNYDSDTLIEFPVNY